MKLTKKYIKGIGAGIGLALAVCALIGLLMRAYIKIKTGHGLDYYISGAGYKFNYIGFFTLFLVIPAAIAGGWAFTKYLKWRESTLERELIHKRLEKRSKRKKRKR